MLFMLSGVSGLGSLSACLCQMQQPEKMSCASTYRKYRDLLYAFAQDIFLGCCMWHRHADRLPNSGILVIYIDSRIHFAGFKV